MKTYPISSNAEEIIEFKTDEDHTRFGLVHTTILTGLNKKVNVTILNKQELITLYQAIREEKKKGG